MIMTMFKCMYYNLVIHVNRRSLVWGRRGSTRSGSTSMPISSPIRTPPSNTVTITTLTFFIRRSIALMMNLSHPYVLIYGHEANFETTLLLLFTCLKKYINLVKSRVDCFKFDGLLSCSLCSSYVVCDSLSKADLGLSIHHWVLVKFHGTLYMYLYIHGLSNVNRKFLCPGLKGPLGASSDQIVRLSVILSRLQSQIIWVYVVIQ